MDNIFTVISLVIAVSGSTYTAIVAIRSYLEDDVKDSYNKGNSRYKEINDKSKSEKTKDGASVFYKKMSRSYSWWRHVFVIPIGVFFFLAYILTVHSLCSCWDGGIQDQNLAFWNIYKYTLFIMLVINLICVVLAFCFARSVKNRFKELDTWFNKYNEEQENQLEPKKIPAMPVKTSNY